MKRNPPAQTFGPPQVSPGVTDPVALNYARDAAARRGPNRYATPVAGGPGPHIPRLDLPADTGLTMADAANMHRAAAEGPAQPPQGGMFVPMTAGGPGPAARPGPGAMQPGILPIDILPEEARQDPDFREGAGSLYASSQPNLARKYGVIRNGARIAPQLLGQAARGLSDKTIADLKAVQEAQALQGQSDLRTNARIEQEAAAGPAGVAGRLGNTPSDGPVADPQMKKNVEEAVKRMDDFDFNTFREMMMKDIINNEEQRELVEKRLTPLDVTDLIMKGFVTQKVPIVVDKFIPEFQSMTAQEDLAIKRLIMVESKGVEVSDRYLLDKFSMMAVVIGLRAVNNNPMPTHQDQKGDFNEEAFWKKFNHVIRYPFHMLASIGVNYYWFDIRVRKLFVADKLGNG